MDKIVRGYHSFRQHIFHSQKMFFERLAQKQQQPKALLITCSDSRINPNLVTQTDPGDLFILRNAGNIIPPHGMANGGEGATIEYAVSVLQIQHIILCGHSHCGAMKTLMDFAKLNDNTQALPAVSNWFLHADATRRIMRDSYSDLLGEELLNTAIEQNVLVQLNNLSTHPVVAAGLSQGTINLYGWRYEIETGTIYEYDQENGQFMPMGRDPRTAVSVSLRRGNGVDQRNRPNIRNKILSSRAD